jgi:hypothetical protein
MKPTMEIKAFMQSIGAFVVASVRFAMTFNDGDSGVSKLRHRWRGRDKNRHALAAVGDDQLSDLSDIGRQIRREERRARNRE